MSLARMNNLLLKRHPTGVQGYESLDTVCSGTYKDVAQEHQKKTSLFAKMVKDRSLSKSIYS